MPTISMYQLHLTIDNDIKTNVKNNLDILIELTQHSGTMKNRRNEWDYYEDISNEMFDKRGWMGK